VGTLDDLVPRPREGAVAASDDEVLALAAETIGSLLGEIGQRDRRIRRLERRTAAAGRGRPSLARRAVRRVRGG
jgi:hypothetical protein